MSNVKQNQLLTFVKKEENKSNRNRQEKALFADVHKVTMTEQADRKSSEIAEFIWSTLSFKPLRHTTEDPIVPLSINKGFQIVKLELEPVIQHYN